MSIPTFTPDCVYLSKDNISHPGTAAQATASATAARLEIATRLNVTSITGGTIKQGR